MPSRVVAVCACHEAAPGHAAWRGWRVRLSAHARWFLVALSFVCFRCQAGLEVYQAVKDIQNQVVATTIKFNVPVRNPKRAHFRVEKLMVEVVLLLKGGLYDVFDNVRDGPVLLHAALDHVIEIQASSPDTVPVSLKVTLNGSALEQAVKCLVGLQQKGEVVHGFRVRGPAACVCHGGHCEEVRACV
jgi:hypothetical protein